VSARWPAEPLSPDPDAVRTAAVQRELAEALRNHHYGATVTGDREQDYRPGAPCMDCGDYPGARHEGSDCPRAVSRALLPTVQRLIARQQRRWSQRRRTTSRTPRSWIRCARCVAVMWPAT
jgi:hypothetical protein